MLRLQELALADPHPVLAAARPAERQGARDDLLVQRPGLVESARRLMGTMASVAMPFQPGFSASAAQ